MDILGEYESQNLDAPTQTRRVSQEYGFFIRLVIKLSGGKIQNGRQASYVLLVAAAVVFLISLLLFLGIPDIGSTTKISVPVETKGPLPH